MTELRIRLKALKANRAWTMAQLGEKLGLSERQTHRLLKGDSRMKGPVKIVAEYLLRSP